MERELWALGNCPELSFVLEAPELSIALKANWNDPELNWNDPKMGNLQQNSLKSSG